MKTCTKKPKSAVTHAVVRDIHGDTLTPAMRAPIKPQQTRSDIPSPMAAICPAHAKTGTDLFETALIESAFDLWARIQTPVMFAVWSIGCFLLGRLS